MRTGQSKAILREGRICFAPTNFFKTAGFGFPPRMRVREECAADSSLIFGGGFKKEQKTAKMRATMEFLRDIKNLDKNDVSLAGGKGASLGEMTKTGIPVPPGFVILASAFEKFLEETDLNIEIDSILDSVNHKEMHTVEGASEKIKALILQAEMPRDIAIEIQKFFKNLNSKYVAVRSSATAEDSVSAAWAGQLESYLNTTEGELLENVKKCWTSLFTPRAIFYRFEKKLHKQKISVAVVVQKMIESEKSGIAFSVHPVTQDRNQLIIEAGFGLGEAIVSGQITPDSYVVEKQPQQIIDKNVQIQTKGLYRAENGGNEWCSIPKTKGGGQVLSDDEILELSELIQKIENHYNFPCDIEWAFDKNFFIVQSRPITTLKKRNQYSPSKEDKNLFGYWDEYNPRVVLPLEYDLYMKDAWQASLDMFDFGNGVPHIQDVVVFDNHVPIQIDPSRYERKFTAEKSDIDLQQEVEKWRKTTKNFREKLGNISKLSKEELLLYLQKIQDIYSKMVRTRMLNMNSWIDVEGKTKDLFEKYNLPFNEEKLIAGIEHETARMNLALNNLAKLYGQPAFDNAFENFIEEFAHFEAEGVSVEESRKTILRYVEELAKSANSSDKFGKRKQEFEKYKSNLLDKIQDSGVRKEIVEVVEKYRKAIKLREDSKTLQDLPRPLIKKIVDEIGERLISEKVLSNTPDVWLLTLDEMKEGNFNKGDVGVRKKIVEEKLEKSWLPDWFREKGSPVKGNILEGVVGSSGVVSGTVKIISGPKEFDRVKKGDIIVAHSTNPLWTQLFGLIAGIIVEHGTILSHAAITAREYEIPCVVSVNNATKIIKEGQKVEVDGNDGVVRVLK